MAMQTPHKLILINNTNGELLRVMGVERLFTCFFICLQFFNYALFFTQLPIDEDGTKTIGSSDISRGQFKDMLHALYIKSLVEPGDAVGSIAAQVMFHCYFTHTHTHTNYMYINIEK